MKSSNGIAEQNIASFNPDLVSVLNELEEGHYLFILADKKKATLILFNKGDIELTKEIMDPGVRKDTRINSGELYGKNTKLEHKIDNQLHRHFQLISQEANNFIKDKHINGVFIGGHQPQFNTIQKALSSDLQNKVRRTFVTELNISHEEQINHCRHILEEYMHNKETK